MKMRKAELLAAIAIVTSAGVLQIREHVQPIDAANHAANASTSVQTAPSTCESRGRGVLPAACEQTRDERPAHRATLPQHGPARIWV